MRLLYSTSIVPAQSSGILNMQFLSYHGPLAVCNDSRYMTVYRFDSSKKINVCLNFRKIY